MCISVIRLSLDFQNQAGGLHKISFGYLFSGTESSIDMKKVKMVSSFWILVCAIRKNDFIGDKY